MCWASVAGFGPVFLVDSLGRLAWWALVLEGVGGLVVVDFGVGSGCDFLLDSYVGGVWC